MYRNLEYSSYSYLLEYISLSHHFSIQLSRDILQVLHLQNHSHHIHNLHNLLKKCKKYWNDQHLPPTYQLSISYLSSYQLPISYLSATYQLPISYLSASYQLHISYLSAATYQASKKQKMGCSNNLEALGMGLYMKIQDDFEIQTFSLIVWFNRLGL